MTLVESGTLPLAALKHLAQVLGRVPHILEAQVQRREAKAQDVRVRGTVTRLTRQVAHVEAEVRTGDGDLVSRATATFLVRRPETGQA